MQNSNEKIVIRFLQTYFHLGTPAHSFLHSRCWDPGSLRWSSHCSTPWLEAWWRNIMTQWHKLKGKPLSSPGYQCQMPAAQDQRRVVGTPELAWRTMCLKGSWINNIKANMSNLCFLPICCNLRTLIHAQMITDYMGRGGLPLPQKGIMGGCSTQSGYLRKSESKKLYNLPFWVEHPH